MSHARDSNSDIGSYLPHSIAATITVFAIPAAILWLSTQIVYLQIPTAVTALAAVGFMALGAAVGSKLWQETAAAEDISFSELMLWSWYRLAQADDRLGKFRVQAARVDASPEHQLRVLQELSDALEAKDPYTRGHSARVERHSFKTAGAMGLSLKEIEVLRRAASLHDVGKIRIPNRVLHKNGPLDEEERSLIEEHPVLGAWMVSTIGDEQIVATVRHHHERWDGAGYPDGISGSEIPLFSRIIAVVDTFDAVTSTRSYRAGSSRKRAIEILRAESGRQFDPEVVETFLTTLPDRSAVVTAMLLLAPEVLWGRLMQLLRRFGGGAVAPGIGAVGAAIVLGTSTFFGGTPTPDALHGRTQATDVGADPATMADLGGATTPSRFVGGDEVLGIRIEAKGKKTQSKARISERKKASATREGSRTSDGSRKRSGAEAEGSPAPAVAKDAASPAPAPEQPVASNPDPAPINDTLESVHDPKRRKGEDCAGLGTASKGSTLHCE